MKPGQQVPLSALRFSRGIRSTRRRGTLCATMRWLRKEMRTSDWAFWGMTYASIFVAMNVIGGGVMRYIGVSPDAEQNRSRTKKVS